jgi:hypothetical protein
MKKTIQVQLPDYFSVKHYKSLGSFEHLDELEKVVYTIVATTEHSAEEVMGWKITDMLSVYKGVSELLSDITNEFYPVFEFKGTLYGFQPLSKMSVAEWIDLDARLKDPMNNLEELMAILYRPITESNFDSYSWKVKNYIKTLMGSSESLFKLYSVEEYDVEKREWRTEVFKDLPITYALGALSFFLSFGMILSKDLVTSSPTMSKEQKKEMIQMIDLAIQSLNTTVGSTSYEESVRRFSTLQEKNQSLS